VPEVVTKHPGFFGTLSTVGLKVVGAQVEDTFEPHQRRFNLLETVTFMSGPEGHILGYDVPPLGCEVMREEMMSKMSICVNNRVEGLSEDVCYGAREKLDGVEVVVFRVKYEYSDAYYLWDEGCIVQVNASQPFQAEKIDGVYYVLSPIDEAREFFFSGTSGETYEFLIHRWKSFTKSLYLQAKEGVIFNVNFREYKVNKIMSFTYRVEKECAFDSTKKMSFSVPHVDDGCWDMAFESDISVTVRKEKYKWVGAYKGELVYLIKKRPDRVYPDSHQIVCVARDKAVRYDKIMNYQLFVMQKNDVRGLALYFRDSQGRREDLGDNSYIKVFVGPEDFKDEVVVIGDTSCDIDLSVNKIVGRDFASSVQERVYFANTVERLLVVQMIVPRRRKEYMSWGDMFVAFYKYSLRYRTKRGKNFVEYSAEFDETSFFKFCVDRYVYLKDGMAYDLCMYKVLMQKGFVDNVFRKRLYVSRVRRKNGVCYAYRQFYVWFDK
jgi:hypothetical protein